MATYVRSFLEEVCLVTNCGYNEISIFGQRGLIWWNFVFVDFFPPKKKNKTSLYAFQSPVIIMPIILKEVLEVSKSEEILLLLP